MATSADVLGSVTRIKVPARWARHYQQLCAERDKLLERDCSSGGAFQPKIDDLADAASQETQRSLSLVSATATHGLLLEIIEAIRRIELGTYGTCQITGEPIALGTTQFNSLGSLLAKRPAANGAGRLGTQDWSAPAGRAGHAGACAKPNPTETAEAKQATRGSRLALKTVAEGLVTPL